MELAMMFQLYAKWFISLIIIMKVCVKEFVMSRFMCLKFILFHLYTNQLDYKIVFDIFYQRLKNRSFSHRRQMNVGRLIVGNV